MTISTGKKYLYSMALAGLLSANGFAQKPHSVSKNVQPPAKNNVKWSVSPFDNKVFIENKGQFNGDVSTDNKILYSATLGQVKLYFTAQGVIYKYDEYAKGLKEKPVSHILNAEWENPNPEVTISAQQESEQFYGYSIGNKSVKANIFKKITYTNLYPGIDIVYYFPDNKEGFEYDIIVHPGADITKVKLNYDGAMSAFVDDKGDALLNTPVGEITDHVPICSYADGGNVKVKYKLSGTEEVFILSSNYDKSKTIVIDPWTTDPKFTWKFDKAYDLDYDNNGSVYVFGGYNPFQLVKLNSAGVIQWTYNANGIDGVIYGGFAVDKVSGTSYLVEGARVAGARILKVNTAGVLVATSAGDANMNEMWRPKFNSCNHNLMIGAGGTTSDFQATYIDTSFTAFTNVNVLGATAAGHSVVLAALDPSGTSCYMAMAKSAVIDPAKFNNVMVKLPLPSLVPTSFNVPDGYKFVELASIGYVGNAIGNTNGMNGMVASLNWLYLYDGGVLKRFSKVTGGLNDSVKVTANTYVWGGLDADICDNVYVGTAKWISVYNGSMALADTINLPDTVYDVKIGASRQVVYACGKGFVKSINVPFTPLSIASTNATCSCNGSATANLCGGADTINVTYLWSNGQTTQTVKNLCGGKYKVTVTLGGCTPVNYFDSVIIAQPPVLIANITGKNNVKCNGGIGNATVTVTGGATPYTYTWIPTGGTNAKADTLYAGSYTVNVKDANGCTATATVSISQPAALKDSAKNTTATCGKSNGTATIGVGGGLGPYKYTWTPSGQTTVTANNLTAGYYVVKVTDANGCIDSATTIVPDAGVSSLVSGVSGEKCHGQSTGTATIAMVGGTGPFVYSWTPSGQTTATATGLPAGKYIASVTDASGCIVTDTIIIKQPKKLVIKMVRGNVACFGGNNGSATARVFGGTTGYAYSWSPVAGSDSTISGLSSGTYSLTVTDTNG
ncbi:MAG TPA: SprB repeat-containing protein, partial [Bacteroidia bacterium]|nr:SprB repeat-containing protein [Bacteroidia bacterium]